jgi:hypothetical protein
MRNPYGSGESYWFLGMKRVFDPPTETIGGMNQNCALVPVLAPNKMWAAISDGEI